MRNAVLLGAWLVLQGGSASADGGVKWSAEELTTRARAFAVGGGGRVYVVAITADPKLPDYSFAHWAGFFTTKPLPSTTAPLVRPSPPFLLVLNLPVHMEAKNQERVEEIIRWEPDGSLVSTGIIYTRAPERGITFKVAAKRLLENLPK